MTTFKRLGRTEPTVSVEVTFCDIGLSEISSNSRSTCTQYRHSLYLLNLPSLFTHQFDVTSLLTCIKLPQIINISSSSTTMPGNHYYKRHTLSHQCHTMI